MNKDRRKELERALELLGQAKEIVECCQSDEQECFENLNEGLQATEKGQQFEINADNLQCAVDEFDTVIEYINQAME